MLSHPRGTMMQRPKFYLALVLAILSSQAPSRGQRAAPKIPKVESRRVCALPTAPHEMSCMARVVTSSLEGLPKASGAVGPATPTGYGPADLQGAAADNDGGSARRCAPSKRTLTRSSIPVSASRPFLLARDNGEGRAVNAQAPEIRRSDPSTKFDHEE